MVADGLLGALTLCDKGDWIRLAHYGIHVLMMYIFGNALPYATNLEMVAPSLLVRSASDQISYNNMLHKVLLE